MKTPWVTVEDGIYLDAANGRYVTRVAVGTRPNQRKNQKEWPLTTPVETMRAWRLRTQKTLRDQAARNAPAASGTLASLVPEYLRTADISAETKKRRGQQLPWWCAQPAAIGAHVLSVKQVTEEAEARERGKRVPDRGRTLGDLSPMALDPKRLREILRTAFAPSDPDEDPFEHASTSNHYRTAIFHFFTDLNQDDPFAKNPVALVQVRQQIGPQPKAQKMRVVAEILKRMPSKFGKSGLVSLLRATVLAWVPITEIQLMRLKVLRDFHDVPDATREEIMDGLITLTKSARRKRPKGGRVPPSETIPLTRYGVAAMRAYAACPAAWGKFSRSSLNKAFQRACRRVEVALATQAVIVDLTDMTIYHLKHSLSTAAQVASAGLVDRHWRVQQSPALVRSLDHASQRTTRIYTESAVDPIFGHVNRLLTQYLDKHLTEPFTTPTLRLVRDARQES